jgi:hypothetical protein
VLLKDQRALRDDQLRIAAAQFCLSNVPPRLRIPLYLGKVEEHFDSCSLGKWVRRHRLDAVIGFSGGVHWGLRHAGFRMPEELGFAVLHRDVDFEHLSGPSEYLPSGMKEMRLPSMLAALELLDQQIRHHQFGISGKPRVLMIGSEWVEGNTLPPKTARPKRRSRAAVQR